LPTITGTAKQGQTLTAQNGSWSGLQPQSYSYSWKRCDTSGNNCTTTGNTTTSYSLTSADVGSTVRVTVTATNSDGTASASSSPTATVTALSPPVNGSVPTVSGTAQQGQTLSAQAGSWSGATPQTYAYLWKRCDTSGNNCAPTTNTTSSYPLTSTDVGTTLKVTVTATNTDGTASASSNATATITTAPSSGSGGSSTSLNPYWRGDFQNGDYCSAITTIFQTYAVNSIMPGGYWSACPDPSQGFNVGYTQWAQDPTQRVYLTQKVGTPQGDPSPWASHQEVRTTDQPWYPGGDIDKSTLNNTAQTTFGSSGFKMGTTRWFRFSFLLPNNGYGEQFNWPQNDWYTLADLHASLDASGDPQDVMVNPWSGNPRYITFRLEGASSTDLSQAEWINLLQLTDSSGNRITTSFNNWHTLIFGITFSDQGTIGNSPGHLTIIFDGQTLYDKNRPTARTGETGPWFQLQNYKNHASPLINNTTTTTIYYANAMIGNTRTDIGG
jgi:hypothetical protein